MNVLQEILILLPMGARLPKALLGGDSSKSEVYAAPHSETPSAPGSLRSSEPGATQPYILQTAKGFSFNESNLPLYTEGIGKGLGGLGFFSNFTEKIVEGRWLTTDGPFTVNHLSSTDCL